MRKIVALKDEFYNRYIIKGNLFAPVIDALVKNNGRYNMMDSAICEMFEHIRSEDIKSLSTHVVENFGQTVDKVLYVNTFKALRQKYEQQQDRQKERSQAPLENVGSILRQGRFRRDPRQLEEEEEMWFNEDDYDDDSPTSASATASSSPMNVPASSASTVTNPVTPAVTSETLNTETPLAAAAAVAAAAGTAVGFVSASNLTSQQQQCSSVTSTGLSGDLGAKNTVFSELNAGKANDKGIEGKISPNNMKKSLVDYDADSDEEDQDEESKSPKKEDTEVDKPTDEEIEDSVFIKEKSVTDEKSSITNDEECTMEVEKQPKEEKNAHENDIEEKSNGINAPKYMEKEAIPEENDIKEDETKTAEEDNKPDQDKLDDNTEKSKSPKIAEIAENRRKEMNDEDDLEGPAAKRPRTEEDPET